LAYPDARILRYFWSSSSMETYINVSLFISKTFSMDPVLEYISSNVSFITIYLSLKI
jgi:hypothetical protein